MSILLDAEAVEFRSLEFEGNKFTLCQVNVKIDHLEIFHKDDSGTLFRRFDKLNDWIEAKGNKLVFAMNAGMYHRNFSPVGLFVSDGKQVMGLNTSKGEGNFFLKPNGVFMLSGNEVRIVDAVDYPVNSGNVSLATQSGPLLVKNGTIHPAFNPNSDSKRIRNGVGVSTSGVAIFVISEDPINFHALARLFKDKLDCPNALYFDGVVSSLYLPEMKRNDSAYDLGTIIGVTE